MKIKALISKKNYDHSRGTNFVSFMVLGSVVDVSSQQVNTSQMLLTATEISSKLCKGFPERSDKNGCVSEPVSNKQLARGKAPIRETVRRRQGSRSSVNSNVNSFAVLVSTELEKK